MNINISQSPTSSSRIAIGLEYDGSNYHGWQSQDARLITLQNTVETALSKVADEPVKIFCAGRTDVGVHALGQVVHFDTTKYRANHSWILGTNKYLPKDIRVHWVQNVSADFNARFSAVARHYRYIIYNNQREAALLRNKVLWHRQQLDVQTMQEAIPPLLGEHDFSAFRASSCQSLSTKRRVHIATVEKKNDFIFIDIKANAFLHHMVRNIVGSLLLIGKGEKSAQWLKELLTCRDRTQGGATATATGLYLLAVEYKPPFSFPAPSFLAPMF